MSETLGKTLKGAREERGLSLREVQEETEIHNAHLSQIERGQIERPELSVLFELAQFYDLSYSRLLELAGYVGEKAPKKTAVATAALRAVGNLSPQQQAEAFDFINRLTRAPSSGHPALSEENLKRLSAIADRALEEADVVGKIPTPLEVVGEVAGVKEVIDVRDQDLPTDLIAKKPKWWKRVLGAVQFRDRVVYIDRDQTDNRARFTQAHEVSHVLLPWHEETIRLDDERNLFYGVRDELEEEANWTAAQLIFQGSRYHERALSDQLSIRTPIALSGEYRASMHASIRYYVQHHPEPVAVLIAGRYKQADGTLPIWNGFESRPFLERFGYFLQHLPAMGLPSDEDGSGIARLVAEAFASVDPPSDKITLMGLDGRQHRFQAEAFFNQYSVFLMVSPARRITAGRRLRLAEQTPD